MTVVPLPLLSRCGLPGIDSVPFGIHACHFYASRDELVSTLVPYFVAGLRENERCLWVTAPPVPARVAAHALRAACDGFDDAVREGALRIIDLGQWYWNEGRLKGDDAIELWLEEEERALAAGYNGLRITGNTSFLKAADWPAFMHYEHNLNARFHGRRIVTLCSYPLAQCSNREMNDVVQAHQCAFERIDSDWQVVARAKFPEVA